MTRITAARAAREYDVVSWSHVLGLRCSRMKMRERSLRAGAAGRRSYGALHGFELAGHAWMAAEEER